MSTSTGTDFSLVAPVPTCERIRVSLEKSKKTLESTSSNQDEREYAIQKLEQICELDADKRAPYHFALACALLAIHSSKDLKERRGLANKCRREATKTLKNIRAEKDAMEGERSLSTQLWNGLEKMVVFALHKIKEEARRARVESGQGKSLEPKPSKARHVEKKKVSRSGAGDGCEEEEEDFSDIEDEEDDEDYDLKDDHE